MDTADGLQKILNVMPNPVFVKDEVHRWVLLNDALIALMGQPREQLIGKSDFDVFPREQAEAFWAHDAEVLQTGQSTEHEETLTDAAGRTLTIVTRKTLVYVGPDGGKPYLVGVISDVTPYREAVERSRYLSYHDPLTSLPNRALFQERLREGMAVARNEQGGLAVVLVDLDRFKPVNDEYGHAAGDEVLRVTADRLSGAVRETDTVARLGGDEFGIIVCGRERPAPVDRIARDICRMVAMPIILTRARIEISASVGIASFRDPRCGPDDLMHQADVAMYTVKRAGRSGYRHYDPAMETEASHD